MKLAHMTPQRRVMASGPRSGSLFVSIGARLATAEERMDRTVSMDESQAATLEDGDGPPGTDAERPAPERASGLRFQSILGRQPDAPDVADAPLPDHAVDLHLDDLISSIAASRGASVPIGAYHRMLADVDAVAYRQEVFRDLEDAATFAAIDGFGRQMAIVRGRLERMRKSTHRYEAPRWLLDAAAAYANAVEQLDRDLAAATLTSRGMTTLRSWLGDYVASASFQQLRSDSARVRAALTSIRYRLRIAGTRVVVSRDRDEPDLGSEVVDTFEKFRQGGDTEYGFAPWPSSSLDHVEAAIVERVARLHPAAFDDLEAFAVGHPEFIDPVIERFGREVPFYLAYLELLGPLRRLGLRFCYPEVVARPVEEHGIGVFDLTLAHVLARRGGSIVANDFHLRLPERILVVSGPNQGGKTTFARTIGQVHHLAAIGAPVPGVDVRVPLVDRIFTHFERREAIEDLTSKLEHDLLRMQAILGSATEDSLLIMNESFSSTTVSDQLDINLGILGLALDRGMRAVVVTFLDELSRLGPQVVSMVSTVDPADPGRRTFRIERRPADGLAYALALAQKHRLTYEQVRSRMPA
jgi:DNA mismatch repair protein MutS